MIGDRTFVIVRGPSCLGVNFGLTIKISGLKPDFGSEFKWREKAMYAGSHDLVG